MVFAKINANPKNKKTSDCAVRAVCQACNISYQEAAKRLFDEWMATGVEMTQPQTFRTILERSGFVKQKKPFHKDGSTYSVAELIDEYGDNAIMVIQVANHWTVSKGHTLIDLWDCSRKSVYGFFIKFASGEELKPIGDRQVVKVRL